MMQLPEQLFYSQELEQHLRQEQDSCMILYYA